MVTESKQKALTEMTGPELVENFNTLLGNKEQSFVDANDEDVFLRPVKRFATKEAGIEKINQLHTLLAEFDDADEIRPLSDSEMKGITNTDGPVAKAKAIFNENSGLGRSANINLCVKAGINKSTAATQWQKFRKESGMSEEQKAPGKIEQIRAFCDKNKGAMTRKKDPMLRKDVVAELVKAGFNKGTANIQVSRWMKDNNIVQAKPEPAKKPAPKPEGEDKK